MPESVWRADHRRKRKIEGAYLRIKAVVLVDHTHKHLEAVLWLNPRQVHPKLHVHSRLGRCRGKGPNFIKMNHLVLPSGLLCLTERPTARYGVPGTFFGCS